MAPLMGRSNPICPCSGSAVAIPTPNPTSDQSVPSHVPAFRGIWGAARGGPETLCRIQTVHTRVQHARHKRRRRVRRLNQQTAPLTGLERTATGSCSCTGKNDRGGGANHRQTRLLGRQSRGELLTERYAARQPGRGQHRCRRGRSTPVQRNIGESFDDLPAHETGGDGSRGQREMP